MVNAPSAKVAAQIEPGVKLTLSTVPDVSLSIKITKKRATKACPVPVEGVKAVIKASDRPVLARLTLVKPSTLPGSDAERAAADHAAAVEAWRVAASIVRASEPYLAHKARYDRRVAAETAVVETLFDLRTARKHGWAFDRSIVTDGVAVSLQFSKAVPRPDETAISRPFKPPKKKRADDSAMAETYDRNLSTLVRDDDGRVIGVVLGVDPGRVNIAAISFALDGRDAEEFPAAAKAKVWALGRGEYYETSGIKRLNAEQRKRFHACGLTENFAALKDCGALRTADASDIVGYLCEYAKIQSEWWSMALRRREARASLNRYSGKRGALDAFFSKVRRAVAALFPGAAIVVGYGSAVQTMRSSGRGEMAVPVSSAFKACQRVFEPSNVRVTNEHRSTAVSWEGACRKEAVYRIVAPNPASARADAGLTVPEYVLRCSHTRAKYMPLAPSAHTCLVERYVAALKAARARSRKAGTRVGVASVGVDGEEEGEEEEESPMLGDEAAEGGPAASQRYPETRGLRFCPERRLYLDRDREAARTIARLCRTEMLGLPRPAVFSKSFKLD